MNSSVDEAIRKYTQSRDEFSLAELDRALVSGAYVVPVASAVKELSVGRYDIPVICIRDSEGIGAVPAFSSLDHLFSWKPEGCLYTTLSGKHLISMAMGMADVGQILVNPEGIPRGVIPRTEFARLLTII